MVMTILIHPLLPSVRVVTEPIVVPLHSLCVRVVTEPIVMPLMLILAAVVLVLVMLVVLM